MKFGVFGGLVAALIIVLLIVAYGTLFTVYQTRQALVVRLGQPIRVVTEPGLNYKIPLVDNVICHRQAHSGSGKPRTGGLRLRSETTCGRWVCALPNCGSAEILPVGGQRGRRQFASLQSAQLRCPYSNLRFAGKT